MQKQCHRYFLRLPLLAVSYEHLMWSIVWWHRKAWHVRRRPDRSARGRPQRRCRCLVFHNTMLLILLILAISRACTVAVMALSMLWLIAYISHGEAGTRIAYANRVGTTIDLAHVARLHRSPPASRPAPHAQLADSWRDQHYVDVWVC